MPLSVGEKLGRYEILVPIGKGGMGEVYRARDTRLNRDVAIKVSAERFTERFEREARAIAALNHPNICHLYDVGPDVMELVKGPTLAEKLAQGSIPFAETIHITRQIANGVEAAHEKGIIHRDLKPGNVKITPDGTVKVLDFGLAKVGGTPTAPIDESPTITIHETKAGVILGTASYMSPEQARGKDVDKRADIWSFGVVLYEMLTGKRLFRGETVGDILAAVLKEPVDFDKAPASTRRLLRRCLEIDPKRRLRDIGEAALELDEILNAPEAEAQLAPVKNAIPRWVWGAAALLALGIVAVAARTAFTPHKPDQPLLRTEITPPEGIRFTGGFTPMALSPDGTKLVFVGADKEGKRMLWLRQMDTADTRAIPGTENAEVPFWSPDSRWVGFAARSKLQKIDVIGGGQPQIICDITGRTGGTWGKGDIILFDQGKKPLQKVSASGGTPVPALQLDPATGETSHGAPYFLPDGQHVLFYGEGKSQQGRIASVDGKLNHVLIPNIGILTYAPNPAGDGGWIIYREPGREELLARPFDPEKLEFTGEAVGIANGNFGNRGWYASSTALLVYREQNSTQSQLSWFGRDGKLLSTVGDPGVVSQPRISSDQESVTFARSTESKPDIWTFDLARKTSARLTFDSAFNSVWSADGKNVLYRTGNGRGFSINERRANGAGMEKVVMTETTNRLIPSSVSRDGRWLVINESTALHSIVMLQSLEDPGKVVRIEDRNTERDPSLSPDGRWVLYSTVPAVRREVVVQSIPKEAGGTATIVGKWQVSTEGGEQPVWRADGKEIFYLAADGKIMAVPIESGENFFRPGEPKPLFQTRLDREAGARQYDVTSDGQRFLLNVRSTEASDAPITLIVNFPKLLKK